MSDNQASLPITLLGAGRMGGAILQTLMKGANKSVTQVVSRSAAGRDLATELGATVFEDLSEIENLSGYLILAIKPEQFHKQYANLKQLIGDRSITIISVMAGVTVKTMAGLGKNIKIIRTMPNTPVAIGAGVTALYTHDISSAERDFVTQIFTPMGYTYWCDSEQELHVATAISGSGSAYGFVLMQALYEAARKQGMADDLAYDAALHTIKGAALLAEHTKMGFKELADQVTSPNGTTRAARNVMDAPLLTLIDETVEAARQRSVALAEETESV